jgi:antitoxin (DNA-binding transcriptional repressor) of toxin-antitoxin stability system
LIDLARAEPVVVAKHGRPVVVVMAVEEYERLKVFEIDHVDGRPPKHGHEGKIMDQAAHNKIVPFLAIGDRIVKGVDKRKAKKS